MTLKTAYIKSNPHFDSKVSASDQKSNLKKRRQEKTDDENGFSFCNPVACENSPNKSKGLFVNYYSHNDVKVPAQVYSRLILVFLKKLISSLFGNFLNSAQFLNI